MLRKLQPKPIFRAPSPKKANQPHKPKRGKGSFQRKARTQKRDVS
jgi:stalled ribosome alternative rescue factor ArfA